MNAPPALSVDSAFIDLFHTIKSEFHGRTHYHYRRKSWHCDYMAY